MRADSGARGVGRAARRARASWLAALGGGGAPDRSGSLGASLAARASVGGLAPAPRQAGNWFWNSRSVTSLAVVGRV